MENYNEKLNFSEIYKSAEHLQEMAKIATVGHYELSVYSDEGPTPHFHFKNLQKENEEGCLKILESDYFKHGRYQAELNSQQRKEIYEFLNQETTEEIYREGTTNFQVICHEWNKNNSQYTISLDTPLPNYRNLTKKGTGHK